MKTNGEMAKYIVGDSSSNTGPQQTKTETSTEPARVGPNRMLSIDHTGELAANRDLASSKHDYPATTQQHGTYNTNHLPIISSPEPVLLLLLVVVGWELTGC